MFRRSHCPPFPSNPPGPGARREAPAATDFPGRYPPVALPANSHKPGGGQRQVRADRVDEPTLTPGTSLPELPVLGPSNLDRDPSTTHVPGLPGRRGTNGLTADSVISIWARSSMRGFTQNRQIGTPLPLAAMTRIPRQNGGYACASSASGGGGASRVPRIAGGVTAGPAPVGCVLVSSAPCAERRRL